jgi:hypothetical protein
MRIDRIHFLGIVLSLCLLNGCSDDKDDDQDPSNPPGGGGGVVVSGTSPEYTFWGDVVTIKGSGFSPVKDENKVRFIQYYGMYDNVNWTSDGDVEIVSASADELKIRVPYSTTTGAQNVVVHQGLDYTRIEVAVGDKKDTTDVVKFIGLPYVSNFEYHYGWWDLPTITRIGDSVLINIGFRGMSGASSAHPKNAGLLDKLSLTIDGHPVPIKRRRISNSTHGYACYMDTKTFGEINCSEEPSGWGARKMKFEVTVDGTDKKGEHELFVQYLPTPIIESVEGPDIVYKDEGDINPPIVIKGKDMYYENARFVPFGCEGPTVEGGGLGTDAAFSDEYATHVPVGLLNVCNYTVYLIGPCETLELVGSVEVRLTR